MKGYASTNDVAAYLGIPLTTAQVSMAEIEIGAAEEWIDNELGFAWLESGSKTKTFYDPQTPFLPLGAPITSVDSVAVYYAPYGADPITLIANQQYWLRDADIGKLWVPWAQRIYKVVVAYTINAGVAVPDSIRLATTAIVCNNLTMSPAFMDGVNPNIVQSYQVGAELQVTFRDTIEGGGAIPQKARDYLDRWMKNYVVVA